MQVTEKQRPMPPTSKEELAEMKKNAHERQEKLRSLITEENTFANIDDIKHALKERFGEEPSQATLSRDLKAISCQKVNGKYIIVEPNEEAAKVTRSKQMLALQARYFYPSIDFFAIKTFRGQGAGIAEAIEIIFGKRIVGTVTGDNVVLVLVLHGEKETIYEEIASLGIMEKINIE